MITYKPPTVKGKIGRLLGLTNSNNIYGRLSKMSRMLNRGRIKSRRRANGGIRSYRKRFNSKMKKCRR